MKAFRAEQKRRAIVRALNKTSIENWLPEGKYYSNNESCVICLDDFFREEPVRKLNCAHGKKLLRWQRIFLIESIWYKVHNFLFQTVFHVKCIDTWILKTKAACPICKQKLVRNHTALERPSANNNPHVGESQAISIETIHLLPTRANNETSNNTPIITSQNHTV